MTDSNTKYVFLKKLFEIRNNLLKMMVARGYNDWVKKMYADITYVDFEKLYRQQNIHLYLYKTIKEDGKPEKMFQTIIYFIDPYSTIGRNRQQYLKFMKNIEKTFDEKSDTINVIFVAEDIDTNERMKNLIKYVKNYKIEYAASGNHTNTLNTELFYYSDVNFNKIDHYLVPRHILMNDADVDNVLSELKIQKDDLAKISINDPISKYYGAKIGDVFKIIRKSVTSGVSPPTYRLVVY